MERRNPVEEAVQRNGTENATAAAGEEDNSLVDNLK